MAEYDTCLAAVEKCRLCGMDLPTGTVEAMYHYNLHWRQSTPEPQNLSQCLYETSDMRLNPISHNPEDVEVSCHFDQYSYSPQTEPSNLCLTETRCSPLNLTGRPRPKSPIVSPLSSPHPQESQINLQQNGHIPPNSYDATNSQMPMQPYINMNEGFDTYNNLNSCAMSNQMLSLPFPPNDTMNNDCLLENQADSSACQGNKKRKKSERIDIRPSSSSRFPGSPRLGQPYFDTPCKDTNITMPDSNYLLTEPHALPEDIQFPSPKPYKCSVCNLEFSQKQELSDHSSVHDAAKPYKCNLCGTGLSHISALRRHTLAHAGLKPHVCDICGRAFTQKCDLQRHYSVHSKKSIECSKCCKKYNSHYQLRNHKCRPEQPKPFKCSICGEGCATNVAWSYHMWKHTKNPIFVPCQTANSSKPATAPQEA